MTRKSSILNILAVSTLRLFIGKNRGSWNITLFIDKRGTKGDKSLPFEGHPDLFTDRALYIFFPFYAFWVLCFYLNLVMKINKQLYMCSVLITLSDLKRLVVLIFSGRMHRLHETKIITRTETEYSSLKQIITINSK